ncbi:MAG: hypothetical protein RBT71_03180 [Flavobacteriales bacterium]|jgi:rod shape-determining protein MreD|nr:hypothetical protein [Flavobacteriales bacterium]
MIGTIASNVLRALALVLVQVMVLDHVDLLNGYAVPYLYVLFLLMLPFELPAWAMLIIAAATGFTVDLFGNTPGMHMSACTVMAFARVHLLRVMAPREGYEFGARPVIADMGLTWTATHAAVLVLVHHLWLFTVELFRWDRMGEVLLRTLLSALFTLVLCMLAQLLATRTRPGRA